jgi:hypothetical protein
MWGFLMWHCVDCLVFGLCPLYSIPEIYNASLVSDWRWRWEVLDGGQMSEAKDHAIVFLIHLATCLLQDMHLSVGGIV